MKIEAEQMRAIARLARLQLSDTEESLMSSQLSQILDYVDQLRELDTEGVEPFVYPIEISNVFGADVPARSLGIEKTLAGAPDRDEDKFRVPRVIEE